MDVFDLIGGERSDISDWEDSSDEEHDEGSEVSDQAPFADAGPKQQPSSIQEDTRPTKNKNFEDMGHQQAACIAGSACCSSVDASADDEESAAEEALKVDTCSADTDCVQAEAPPPLQSKDGDALNLFTINPVSKEDAKNYAPLLGMHSELEPAGGAFDESAAGDDSSPAALSNAFSPRRAKIPFLDAHPELDVLVLDNVLSERECARIVATAEASHGFSFWDARPEARKDYRDADTIEVFDDDFSVLLWSRIAQFFSDPEAGTAPNPGSSRIRIAPQEDLKDCRWQRDLVGEWVPTGTNNNLLVARYHPHGHFAPHTDGYSIIDFNNRSMYSIVLYLNTIPKGCGGGTRFYSDEQKGKLIFDPEQRRYVGQPEHELGTIDPVCGRVAMFFHNHMHEGVPPVHGYSKYIIRSDVMYARTPAICTSKADQEAFRLYQKANALSGPGSEVKAMELFQKCFSMSPGLADVFGM